MLLQHYSPLRMFDIGKNVIKIIIVLFQCFDVILSLFFVTISRIQLIEVNPACGLLLCQVWYQITHELSHKMQWVSDNWTHFVDRRCIIHCSQMIGWRLHIRWDHLCWSKKLWLKQVSFCRASMFWTWISTIFLGTQNLQCQLQCLHNSPRKCNALIVFVRMKPFTVSSLQARVLIIDVIRPGIPSSAHMIQLLGLPFFWTRHSTLSYIL